MKKDRLFQNKYSVLVIVVLCTLLWGTAPSVIKIGYRDAFFGVSGNDIPSQILFAGARFLTAGVILLISGFLSTGKKMLPGKSEWKPLVIIGVIQTTMHYLFTFVGVAHTSGTKTSIFTASSAFMSVLAAPLFFKKEKIDFKSVIGCIVGLAGLIFINFDSDGKIGFAFMGEGFILLSCVCYVTGNFISKMVGGGIGSVKLNGWQMFTGGVILVAIGLIFGGRLHFNNWKCYLIVLYLALVSTVAFTLWTKVLIYNPAGKIGIYNLLIPIFSTAFSGILLGEEIFNLTNLVSLLLVCGGIGLVNYQSVKRTGTEDKS